MKIKLFTLFSILFVFIYAHAGVVTKDKAEFIINLFDKVEWPEGKASDASGEIVISVIGSQELTDAIKSASGKTTGKKFRVESKSINDDFTSSHMLVVATAELSELAKILKAIKKKPVLTVTESKGFARYGVMIEMLTDGDKLEFVINKMSAKDVNIIISSKLIDKAKATFG